MARQQLQETSAQISKVQPGESLAHFCATHIYDHQCEANPGACAAFCGYKFGEKAWNDVSPECVVCADMLEERDDPDCHCKVCTEIADG